MDAVEGGVCRAVSYRLYPTVGQQARLVELLGSQCDLYNAALEERRGVWRWERRKVTWVEQFKQLSGLEARQAIPSLDRFGLAPHRGTLKRLDEAFAGFFARVKAGRTAGFPRFKSKSRWDSVTYPEAQGWKIYQTGTAGTYGRLRLGGVGHVAVRLAHGGKARVGVPAKLVLRRTAGRRPRWAATVFFKNCPARTATQAPVAAAGVDRGVTVLAAVADTAGGRRLDANPRYLAHAQGRLAAKQQILARRAKGTARRRWAAADVARAHRRVADARRNHLHRLYRSLVERFHTIVLEDLKIANMTRSAKGTIEAPGTNVAQKSGLNRAIADAGWATLAGMISYKAEEAGRGIVTVKPHHSSQTCAVCGHVDPGSRQRQVFCCTACGHQDHADLNAAQVLLQRAGYTTLRPGPGPALAA